MSEKTKTQASGSRSGGQETPFDRFMEATKKILSAPKPPLSKKSPKRHK